MLQQNKKEPSPWEMQENLNLMGARIWNWSRDTGLRPLLHVAPRAARAQRRGLQSTEGVQGWGQGELGSGSRCVTHGTSFPLSGHQLFLSVNWGDQLAWALKLSFVPTLFVVSRELCGWYIWGWHLPEGGDCSSTCLGSGLAKYGKCH